MASLVEVTYNPYIPNLSIIIDGNPPSDFCKLVQYTDEDIMFWYYELLDAIYSEIRNDFIICFIGTKQDADILENMCRKYKSCVGFKAKEFSVSETLQSRMKKLNQILKARKLKFAKTIINANFIIPSQLQEYSKDILSLDINNLFCSVKFNQLDADSIYNESDDSFLFLLTDPDLVGIEKLKYANISKPVFVIVFCNENQFIKADVNNWYFGTTAVNLINTIFMCMLMTPLMTAFRKCINSIECKTNSYELKKLSAIEPIVKIDILDKIEVGKSSKIKVSLDPPIGKLPKLIYKISNQEFASCDGLCIYAKKEGTVNFEVYREGDKKPYFTKSIYMYKRNRITKIILSDDTIMLGCGDSKKMNADYFPQNADNVKTMQWKSSDESIIKVDNNGFIKALGTGSCRIICTAENISAQCMCTVKPYLENISFEVALEDGIMYLEPMDEVKLNIKTYPNNCIDDEVTVTSSDCNVVNVIKKTLYAKTKGEANIIVRNVNGRVSNSFKVIVLKKKNGFFANIFRKK